MITAISFQSSHFLPFKSQYANSLIKPKKNTYTNTQNRTHMYKISNVIREFGGTATNVAVSTPFLWRPTPYDVAASSIPSTRLLRLVTLLALKAVVGSFCN